MTEDRSNRRAGHRQRSRNREDRQKRRQEREARRAERHARRSAARAARSDLAVDDRGDAPQPDDGQEDREWQAILAADEGRWERDDRAEARAAAQSEPDASSPHATSAASAADDIDEPTKDELLREARRIARAKARVVRELVEFAVVVGVLSMVFPVVAWIVGIIWGLDLSSKFAKRILEPSLRRRWVDREVSRRLQHTMPVERRQIEGEHSRRIEELAAGVAHEIRNPITAAKSLVQQMGEDPGAGENVDYAKVALDELERVEKSVAHLLRFAREEDLRAEPVSLEDVIDSAVSAMHDRTERSGVAVETELDDIETVVGDPEQLRRVMLNLLSNSLDAIEEAGREAPRILIQAGENLAGTEVWIRVKDNGPGIEPERLSRIFSPFYTSKSTGTGLGLAISKKVIDAHGGSIQADSDPGRGTEFVITLPKTGEAGEHPAPGSPE